MRKRLFSALMISLLLLSGCGRRQAKLQSDFAAFRESVRTAENAAFELALRCDDGGTVTDYTLRLVRSADGCRVTVVEPTLLAGVTATVSASGTELGCEGVSLGVGTIAGLTPITAGAAMLKAIGYGYEELLWREDDYTVARLWLDSGAVMTLWLDKNAVPVCAEISEDGAVVMSAAFSGWELYGG